ncbi:hypothetical protein IAT40_003884 [Kwoniella sp. CBS 6097]
MSPHTDVQREDPTTEQPLPYSSPPMSCKTASLARPSTVAPIGPHKPTQQEELSFPSPDSMPSTTINITGLTAEERIADLLQTISAVLTSYSALPTASQVYISSLTRFYQRALHLSPDGTDARPSRSPLLASPGFSSHGSGTSLSQTLLSQSQSPSGGVLNGQPVSPPFASPQSQKARETRRPSLGRIDEDSTPVTASEEEVSSLSLEEKIEALEREWWDSEVVAAWYGPRPRSRALSSSGSATPSELSSSQGSTAIASSSDVSSSSPYICNLQTHSESFGKGVQTAVNEADGRPPLTRKKGFSRGNGITRSGGRSTGTGIGRGGVRRPWDGRQEFVGMFYRGDAGYVGLHDE